MLMHRLCVSGQVVTAVRERVERRLGVETEARPEGDRWGVYFETESDVNLDFLRPDVLPPVARASRTQVLVKTEGET